MATNLNEATRELYEGAVHSQVSFKFPMYAKLIERGQVREGGLQTAINLEIANSDDLVQEYGPNEGVLGGSKDILGKAFYNVAFVQVPIEENVDERLMNRPKTDAQLVDLSERIVKSTTKGLRIRLAKRFWGCATDTEKDELHTLVQGIPSALKPDTIYATVDRSAGQNAHWQPAGFADTYTHYNLSRRLLRKWINEVEVFAEEPGSIIVILGTSLYERMVAEFEAHAAPYRVRARKAIQGFNSIELDGVEIMEDPFLDMMTIDSVYHEDGTPAGLLGDQTANGVPDYTGKNVVAILNMATWKLRYFGQPTVDGKKQDMITEITDFFDQSQVEGGREVELAHAMTKCNLCCYQPNVNMIKINVH